MGLEVQYLTAGSPNLNASLTGWAQSVIVDNWTSSIVDLPGVGAVPAYTIGWSRPLKATQVALANLIAGTGAANPPVLPSSPAYQVQLTYYDQPQPISNGVSLLPTQVTIGSGTVTVSGIVSVSISGTPNVNIANTPAVTVNSGTINIGNTPSVTISGTPTVILGGGTATIGSVSAINSTVTVAGTINIGNTPSVSISGTPSVTIASGTVSITGTPNINIQSQSVNLNTQQPQTSLGNFVVPLNGTNSATYVLPAGTHAIGIMVASPGVTALSVKGVTTNTFYINLNFGNSNTTGYFVSPVLSVLDTSVTVSGSTQPGVGPTTIYSVAILDAEGVFTFDNLKEPLASYLTDQFGTPIVVTDAPRTQQALAVNPLEGITGYNPTTFTPAALTPFTLQGANSLRKQLTISVFSIRFNVYGNVTVTAGSGNGQFVQMNALNGPAYYELPRNPNIYTDTIKAQAVDAGGTIFVVEYS